MKKKHARMVKLSEVLGTSIDAADLKPIDKVTVVAKLMMTAIDDIEIEAIPGASSVQKAAYYFRAVAGAA